MTATSTSVFVNSAVETLFPVWVELSLCVFSAIAYFMFSSKYMANLLSPKKQKKMDSPPSPQMMSNKAPRFANALPASSAVSSPRSNAASDDVPAGDCMSQGTANQNLAQASKKIAMRANDIRSCGRNGHLAGAVKVFEKLGQQADCAFVHNSMMDACVECHDLEKAVHYFERACRLGLADSVTYNKMMKGYLSHGSEAGARKLLAEMPEGIANATSYHGLLNARVNAGDMRGGWKLVTQMQANGLCPNSVTCAILLKGRLQSVEEVSRVLLLVDAMEESMDEVLFMAVAEACVRVNRLDMLTKQLERFTHCGASGLSAETYGSLMKAYGRARDTKRVWDLWGQMVKSNVQMTSVTLGCMVEALVANGQSTEALKLVMDLLNDESTQPLVNTIICSSILKGFAYTRDAEKVMALYKQMKAHSIQPNTITFNTILNAFAQCGTMQHAPQLLEDMKAVDPPVAPDIVTYSTLIKGFCYSGSLDRALEVFTEMQREGTCAPDEVMFNSLLGGCAKEFRLDDALKLLSDMRKAGIAPSNYTLSMLVKLMCRCRRLEQAFTVLEDISKEYNFRINIQVYTCLIQGCFYNGQMEKALSVYDKIMSEGLSPDATTFSVLVRGCLRAGSAEKAAELARHANKTKVGLNAGCFEEIVAALGGPSSKSGSALLSDLGESSPATQPSVYRAAPWRNH